MEFQDKALRCVSCGAEFIWTAGEQAFFSEKGFKNEPKRCKACKSQHAHAPVQSRERLTVAAVCALCGRETTLPFRPTQGRPVFCRECFEQRKQTGNTRAAGAS